MNIAASPRGYYSRGKGGGSSSPVHPAECELYEGESLLGQMGVQRGVDAGHDLL